MVGETNTALTGDFEQNDIAAKTNAFSSVDLLNQSLGKTAIDVYLYSDTYKALLLNDYNVLPINIPDALDAARVADNFFSKCGFPVRPSYSPVAQIEAWEYILGLMAENDPNRYRELHKGTPFYFLGMASYSARDFEKALFYMDAALEEDLRLHKDGWPNVPSGKFVLLDDSTPDQAARRFVTSTRKMFESLMTEVAAAGGIGLSVDDLREKLVRPAMVAGSVKRSSVTGLVSFLLEFSSRAKELSLGGSLTSTGEPFFLHLFKGALLFETLLKISAAGSVIQTSNPKATINTLLMDPTIYQAFDFANQPQGLGAHTFDDVLQAIKSDPTVNFTQRAVRATWGIRNTTGHSLGWPYRPDPDEYKQVYQMIVAALSATLANLHS
jgi:hypothetical protein